MEKEQREKVKKHDSGKQLFLQVVSFPIVGFFCSSLFNLLAKFTSIEVWLSGYSIGWLIGITITIGYWAISYIVASIRFPNDHDYTFILADFFYVKRLNYRAHFIVLLFLLFAGVALSAFL